MPHQPILLPPPHPCPPQDLLLSPHTCVRIRGHTEPPFPKPQKRFWLKKVGFAKEAATRPLQSPTKEGSEEGRGDKVSCPAAEVSPGPSCHRGKGQRTKCHPGKLGFLSFLGRRGQGKSWERPSEI